MVNGIAEFNRTGMNEWVAVVAVCDVVYASYTRSTGTQLEVVRTAKAVTVDINAMLANEVVDVFVHDDHGTCFAIWEHEAIVDAGTQIVDVCPGQVGA